MPPKKKRIMTKTSTAKSDANPAQMTIGSQPAVTHSTWRRSNETFTRHLKDNERMWL